MITFEDATVKFEDTLGSFEVALRDYGPDNWKGDEAAARRDAELTVLDAETLSRRCELLREFGAAATAPHSAVDDVTRMGMNRASSNSIQAVMRDPAALCEVHHYAWTSSGNWAKALKRYRSSRLPSSRRPAIAAVSPPHVEIKIGIGTTQRTSRPARRAAARTGRFEEVPFDVVLGECGAYSGARGTLRFWRPYQQSPPDSWWVTLTLNAPQHLMVHDNESAGDKTPHTAVVSCVTPHGVTTFGVLLHHNDRGELISDRYSLSEIDPTSQDLTFEIGVATDTIVGSEGE